MLFLSNMKYDLDLFPRRLLEPISLAFRTWTWYAQWIRGIYFQNKRPKWMGINSTV